jgi:hypothetical protein
MCRVGTALTFIPARRNRKQSVKLLAMTRRLVLTSEDAGHPFRRSQPPVRVAASPRRDDQDWKLFLLSFGAFFTCFATFIL